MQYKVLIWLVHDVEGKRNSHHCVVAVIIKKQNSDRVHIKYDENSALLIEKVKIKLYL